MKIVDIFNPKVIEMSENLITSCSVPGCTTAVSLHQMETTKKLYGKIFCITHEKDAKKEADAATESLMPAHIKVLKEHGWDIQNGVAAKIIAQSEVTIDLSKIKQPSAAVLVAGHQYQFGLHNLIDAEIKSLFRDITKAESATPKLSDPPMKGQLPEPTPKTNANPLMPLAENNWPLKPKEPETVSESIVVHKPSAVVPAPVCTPTKGYMIKGFVPQLKEIGKIKIGKKGALKESAGGKQFRQPVKFDHFEITGILKDDKTGDFLPDPIMSSLEKDPTSLDIMLLYNDPTLNFFTRYNAYRGGKCLCRGDGETATTIDGDTIVCNPDACETFQKKGCKPNGILACILAKSPRLGGVHKFRTTSFNTIRSILSSLMFLHTLTGGVLAMIPLKLTVSPMQVQPKDSPSVQTIYVVNVEFAGTAQQLLQTTFEVQKYQGAMRAQIALAEERARAALMEPESDEESKEVEAEFYPGMEATK